MGGNHSRNKGKAGEREVAQLLRIAGFDARRGFQSRAGTDECAVEGIDEVRDVGSFGGFAAEFVVAVCLPVGGMGQARARRGSGQRGQQVAAITEQDHKFGYP